MSNDREHVIRTLRWLADEARKGQTADAHPVAEDLAAYHASELSAEQDRAIQRHLAICHECSELVLALNGFPDGESVLPPTEAESSWQEVRRRLAEVGWFQDAPKRRSWVRHSLVLAQLRPIAAVAASFLVGLLIFLAPITPLAPIVYQPEAGATASDLLPATRGPVQEIAVPSSAGHFYLGIAPEGSQVHSEYQVELRTAEAGGKVWWSNIWHPRSDTDLFLRIPRGFLPAGKYQVKLQGLAGGRPVQEPVDERSFQLSYH